MLILWPSNDDFRLLVLLAELRRVAPLTATEQSVEVAEVVEPAAPAYLADAVGGVHQSAGSQSQSDVDDVLAEVLSRAQLEEAAEGRGRHADEVGQLFQSQGVADVRIDEVLDLQDAARLATHVDLGERRRRQLVGIVELGQLVQDGQEFLCHVELVGHRRQACQPVIDSHDGRHGEGQSALGAHHHIVDRLVGVGVEDAVLVLEIDEEMDGYLVDVIAVTLVLLPHVFEVATGDERQLVVADDLAGVAHHTACSGTILHEVQLHDVVAVDGVVELLLMTVGDIHEVVVAQWGNLA